MSAVDRCRPLSTAVDCRPAVDCQPLSTLSTVGPLSTIPALPGQVVHQPIANHTHMHMHMDNLIIQIHMDMDMNMNIMRYSLGWTVGLHFQALQLSPSDLKCPHFLFSHFFFIEIKSEGLGA